MRPAPARATAGARLRCFVAMPKRRAAGPPARAKRARTGGVERAVQTEPGAAAALVDSSTPRAPAVSHTHGPREHELRSDAPERRECEQRDHPRSDAGSSGGPSISATAAPVCAAAASLAAPEQSYRTAGYLCVICQGLLLDPVALCCGHTFCEECLAQRLVTLSESYVARRSGRYSCPAGCSSQATYELPRPNLLLREAIASRFPEQLAARRAEAEPERLELNRRAVSERTRRLRYAIPSASAAAVQMQAHVAALGNLLAVARERQLLLLHEDFWSAPVCGRPLSRLPPLLRLLVVARLFLS